MNEKEVIFYIVKTNKGCFISDCKETTKNYNYDYHRSIIPELLFDDKKAQQSYLRHWYFIDSYPVSIKKKEADKSINTRYEIVDKTLVSDKIPEIILSENFDNDSLTANLYNFSYDTIEGSWVDFPCILDIIYETDDFTFPTDFKYSAKHQVNFKDESIILDRNNIKHSMLYEMILPEIMLQETPCELSSPDVYKIVREHIKNNIDLSVARITSDYDFCFTVRKILPLFKPEIVFYQNIFASTKKARAKIHKSVQEYKEITVFEMTDSKRMYNDYTPIPSIQANNEVELKEKLDSFLEQIMIIINKKYEPCPHCEGTGYIEVIEKIDSKKIITSL